MSRFRLLGAFLVATVASIALFGVSTGAASAATFTLSTEECNGTIWNLCWSEKEESSSPLLELTGTQTVTVAKKTGSANVVFKGTIGGIEFTIECTGVTQGTAGANVIEQPEPLKKSGVVSGTLLFTGCKLTAPAELVKECNIPEEKETTAIKGELINAEKVTSEKELRLTPKEGEKAPFIELTFENKEKEKCPETFTASAHAVTGVQVIEVLNPSLHELTKSGKAIGSTLKLAGSPATVTGELTMSFPGLEDWVDIGLA